MTAASRISEHYSRGNLLERLCAVLREEGIDPDHPTVTQLAPFDHFHGRGLEATEELANALSVSASDRLLDIGCGIGGPARYVAQRFGCHVTGIDLTDEFCDVARTLTRVLGLEDRAEFHQGNALTMPFTDSSFDGAYSMNVSMNIADKAGLYHEIHRVLKPGAWLVLSELTQGPGDEGSYPTPWARTAAESFLSTQAQTRQGLEAARFAIEHERDTLKEALAFGARSRAAVERGEKPPHRAVQLIHGELAAEMAANTARGLKGGSYFPIEIFCRKR